MSNGIETFKRSNIGTSANFSGGTSGLLNVANASTRLMNQLKGLTSQALEASKDQITAETQAKALEDIKTGNVNSENVAAVARNVYRNTANHALLADVEVSSKKLGDKLVNDQVLANNYNVNSFTTEWGGYKKGILSGIQDPAVRNAISNTLNKQEQNYVSQVATLETKQQFGIQKENLLAKLSMDTNSFKASFGINGAEALGYQQGIDQTLAVMVESNLLAPNTALLKRQQIYRDVYINKQQRDFNTALNNGTSYKFFDNFKKADHFGVLRPEDITKFKNSMMAQIQTDIKVFDLQNQEETDQAEAVTKTTISDFNNLWLDDQLTPQAVDDALSNNLISTSQHKEYLLKANDTGPLVDNQNKLLWATTHLLEFTENEILESPDFTTASKADLIAKRRTQSDDAANWLGTQAGREARRRIRENFNILDGTMMSKLDFNNDTMRAYDDMYREFFGEVEALPLEQRASKSILISDRLLKAYKTNQLTIKNDKLQARKDKKEEKENKAIKDYNSSVTGRFMSMFADTKEGSQTKITSEFEKLQEQFD